jgi:ribosomal-protein-alanine N-acetyltransferase
MSSIVNNLQYPATIETAGLTLKAVTPALLNELIISLSPEEFMHYIGIDASEYAHYQAMHTLGMETHRISLYFFLLVHKADNIVIGDCGFHTWNRTHRRTELFYNLRNTAYRNKGLMKEALAAVIAYGFTHLNLNRIEALVAKENEPSVKLIKGNGFTFEGTMREDYVVDGKPDDSDCYSLLLREWLEKK